MMLEKKCLRRRICLKKMFAETYMLKKKMFAETYMFEKNVCGDVYVKKKFCERTFLIHPLQKNNGPSLIITHTY